MFAKDIALASLEMLDRPIQACKMLEAILHEKMQAPLDVPDSSFIGPLNPKYT